MEDPKAGLSILPYKLYKSPFLGFIALALTLVLIGCVRENPFENEDNAEVLVLTSGIQAGDSIPFFFQPIRQFGFCRTRANRFGEINEPKKPILERHFTSP